MYCLDTNILIDYLRGNIFIKEKIETLFDLNLDLTVTTITLCEIYKGIFLIKNHENELSCFNEFTSNFETITITKKTAMIFGKLNSELKEIGKTTEELDLIIASIAIANNQILVTRDKKHFENIPELKLEIW